MSEKRQIVYGDDELASKLRKVEADVSQLLQLNKKYLDDVTAKNMQDCWTSRQNFQSDESGLKLCHIPFSHCILTDFIQSDEAVVTLHKELQDLEFTEKNNDLYQFYQTKEDLKTAESPQIRNFRKQLCTTLREWLIKATGIPLNETVDMFCAQYRHTDTLLCHDDELEGRRIAYIYYVVNSWESTDGGTLDLFTVDENTQPLEIVKSIVPLRNSLVFFEVSPGSFHQVSEVLSEDKTRWSIGGWFHGPAICRPTPSIDLDLPRPLHPYGTIDDDVFFDWINPVYLGVGAQGSIQEKFEEESEIELQDFIQVEKYEELLAALKSENVTWNKKGPPNKRCYYQAEDDKLPTVLKTCIELFKSDAMFLMLSNFTGLKLHELAGASSGSDNDGSDSESESGSKPTGDPGVSQSCSTSTTGTDQSTDGTNPASGCSTDKAGVSGSKDEACTSRCRSEARRWTDKCYTLGQDTDTEGSEFALDVVYYVGCQDWEADYGGFTSYIAKEEDEELLTVTPRENSLALVYRDKKTLKFVKYLNNQVRKMHNHGFYDISTVYYE